MIQLEKNIIPSLESDDKTLVIRGGKVVSQDLGTHELIFISHEETESGDIIATQLKVRKPVTRGKLINQAEMDAYGLQDAMDVASFGTSLSRKARINPADPEVIEHDEFISWIKNELNSIGYV